MSVGIGTSYNYLTTLYSGLALGQAGQAPGGAAALLATLSGGGATAAQAYAGNPVEALADAQRNRTRDVARTAAEPEVKRATDAFRAALADAKSPADLLNDNRALTVLLTANGLGDQAQFTALAKKALLSDPSDPDSLVNKLSDPRWKSLAQTYQFATRGLSLLKSPGVADTVARGYADVTWRTSLDAATPGLAAALDFQDRAGRIRSADDVLGDPTFRKVVTTALGVPQQIAFQSLTAQEQAISSRIDVTKFQDPKFVQTFAQRYLIAAGQAAANQSAPASSLTSLAAQLAALA